MHTKMKNMLYECFKRTMSSTFFKKYLTEVVICLLAFSACVANGNDLEELYQKGRYSEILYELAQQSAQEGSPVAQRMIGNLFYDGILIEKNIEKMIFWYEKAARQNDVNSMNVLAELYLGEGGEENIKKAVYWLKKAIDLGSTKAIYNMGVFCFEGYGVPKNIAKSVDYFQKAAKLGEPEAHLSLGFMYLRGIYFERNLEEAISQFIKGADKRSLKSMRALQELYLSELKNEERALLWKKRADQIELDKANLFIENGFYRPALNIFYRVAQTGNEIAQFLMWNFYYNHKESYVYLQNDAFKYLVESAEQRYFPAKVTLAWIYFEGKYIAKNDEKADFWARKAISELQSSAMNGDDKSQGTLALFYLYGLGIPKDEKKANYWSAKALEKNSDYSKKVNEIVRQELQAN